MGKITRIPNEPLVAARVAPGLQEHWLALEEA